jgi:hypothetical protein
MFPDLTRDDVFRLETTGLWLRWPRQSDKAGLLRARERIMPDGVLAGPHPALAFAPPLSHGEAESLVLKARQANASGEALVLAITRKGRDGEALGLAALVPAGQRQLRVTLWLAASADLPDITTESLIALAQAAFRLCEIDSLELDPSIARQIETQRLDRLGFAVPTQDYSRLDSGAVGLRAAAALVSEPARIIPRLEQPARAAGRFCGRHVGAESTGSRWSADAVHP